MGLDVFAYRVEKSMHTSLLMRLEKIVRMMQKISLQKSVLSG